MYDETRYLYEKGDKSTIDVNCFNDHIWYIGNLCEKYSGIVRRIGFISGYTYVMLSGGMSLGGMKAVGWINLLIVGLVHTGVTYCMYFSSLKELPGQKAAILSYIDPLVAVLISVTILGEKMTIWQIAGGVLILGFTLWNEVSPNTKIMGGRNVFSGSDC